MKVIVGARFMDRSLNAPERAPDWAVHCSVECQQAAERLNRARKRSCKVCGTWVDRDKLVGAPGRPRVFCCKLCKNAWSTRTRRGYQLLGRGRAGVALLPSSEASMATWTRYHDQLVEAAASVDVALADARETGKVTTAVSLQARDVSMLLSERLTRANAGLSRARWVSQLARMRREQAEAVKAGREAAGAALQAGINHAIAELGGDDELQAF